MSVEIKPGPELDRAVAKAIGLKWPVDEGPPRRAIGLFELMPEETIEVGACDPLVTDEMICRYSTDLNAAFAAAEKVGLWLMYALGQHDGAYEVFANVDYHLADDIVAEAPTPALAICAAILKLKETE